MRRADVFASARLATGWEPIPTPTSGWLRITVAVIVTSRERPLVACRREWSRATLNATSPAASSAAAAAPPRMKRLVRSASTRLIASAAAKSTAMLDCEYEK